MGLHREEFNLVDGWWTFFKARERRRVRQALEIPAKQTEGQRQNPFITREVLSGSEKLPLSRAFQADARTRTGDPFITSEVLYQLSYVGAAGPV
jgi:hypothetical protein